MKRHKQKKHAAKEAAKPMAAPTPKANPNPKPTADSGGPAAGQPVWTPSTDALSESTLRNLVFAAPQQAAERSSGNSSSPGPDEITVKVTMIVDVIWDEERNGQRHTKDAFARFSLQESQEGPPTFSITIIPSDDVVAIRNVEQQIQSLTRKPDTDGYSYKANSAKDLLQVIQKTHLDVVGLNARRVSRTKVTWTETWKKNP